MMDDIPDMSDPAICKVLWAAMVSMVHGIHAPQDNLSEDEWDVAVIVFDQLNTIMDGYHK